MRSMFICLLLTFAVATALPSGDASNLALRDTTTSDLQGSAGLLQMIDSIATQIIQKTPISSMKKVSPHDVELFSRHVGSFSDNPRSTGADENDAILAFNSYVSGDVKTTVATWRTDVCPALVSTINAILNCSSRFLESYDQLIDYASSCETDPQARANLTNLLESLKSEVARKSNETSAAGSKLNAYLSVMLKHTEIAETEYNRVEVQLKGHDGVAQSIQERIRRVREQRDRLHRERDDAGRVNFWDFVPIVNFFVWSHRGNVIKDLGNDISDRDNEITSLSRKLEEVNRNIDNAASTKADIGTFTGLIRNANNRTDETLRAWNQLERDCGQTLEALRNTDTNRMSLIVRNRLIAARKHWSELNSSVLKFRNQWQLHTDAS